jgi:hypothetical protein
MTGVPVLNFSLAFFPPSSFAEHRVEIDGMVGVLPSVAVCFSGI